MSTQDIIRAWKDEAYRDSLNETERALLPEHPAGLLELTDDDLRLAGGAPWTYWCTSYPEEPDTICYTECRGLTYYECPLC